MDVSGWDTSAGSVKCPQISGVVSCDHTIKGKVYMLVHHQAIHCPRLIDHLILPIKSRMAGVSINDIPKFLSEDTDDKTNETIVNDPLNPNEPLIIPLVMKRSLVISLPGRQEKVSMRMSPSRILK